MLYCFRTSWFSDMSLKSVLQQTLACQLTKPMRGWPSPTKLREVTKHVNVYANVHLDFRFTEFATFLLHNPSFDWTISTMKLKLTALGTIFDNVSLTKTVSFKALNGLPGVTISNFQMPSDDPAGGIHIETDASIPSSARMRYSSMALYAIVDIFILQKSALIWVLSPSSRFSMVLSLDVSDTICIVRLFNLFWSNQRFMSRTLFYAPTLWPRHIFLAVFCPRVIVIWQQWALCFPIICKAKARRCKQRVIQCNHRERKCPSVGSVRLLGLCLSTLSWLERKLRYELGTPSCLFS